MRIGLISASFLPRVGGMEWKVHYLASEYTAAGHDVVVFTSPPDRSRRNDPMPVRPSYGLRRCGPSGFGVARLGISHFFFRRAILAAHREGAFDVMHSHHLGLPTRYAVAAKHTTGVPVVATTCGGDVQVLPEAGYGDRLHPRFDRIVRRNLAEVDVVGSISSTVREELDRIGTAARIVDIPNGVPWEDFQTGPSSTLRERLGLPDDALILLSLGRNQPVKGYDLGIRAFSRVAPGFPNAVYVLVGRAMDRLRPLVEEHGLGEAVRFLPEVPLAEVPRILRSADVFFGPSLMEGFSQVNVQALACGLPCVVSDAGGNRDLGDGGGVLLARTRDVESMADALGKLLSSDELRARLRDEAVEAGKSYSWKRIAARYLEVFASLS